LLNANKDKDPSQNLVDKENEENNYETVYESDFNTDAENAKSPLVLPSKPESPVLRQE